MRVSGAAKVQWSAPRRKMGEFLEISRYTTGIPRAKKLKLGEWRPASHRHCVSRACVGSRTQRRSCSPRQNRDVVTRDNFLPGLDTPASPHSLFTPAKRRPGSSRA
jgi:hypothetical protein